MRISQRVLPLVLCYSQSLPWNRGPLFCSFRTQLGARNTYSTLTFVAVDDLCSGLRSTITSPRNYSVVCSFSNMFSCPWDTTVRGRPNNFQNDHRPLLFVWRSAFPRQSFQRSLYRSCIPKCGSERLSRLFPVQQRTAAPRQIALIL